MQRFAALTRALGLVVIAMTSTSLLTVSPTLANAESDGAAIRPLMVRFPQKPLVELRRRIAAARWPTSELVEDRSQSVST